MTWQEALEEIQSPAFDANLNVVSGLDAFVRGAGQIPAVKEAYRQMSRSTNLSEEVLGLLYAMAQLDVDPRYENPKDTPLAVLLWLLSITNPTHALRAAFYVDRAPRCWYAKKLARSILTPWAIASTDL